jgi:hypothetical protein
LRAAWPVAAIMKISVLPGEPGFRDDARLWRVTVNGVPVRNLVMADDEAGICISLKCDESGCIVTKDGEPVVAIQRGVIAITRS